MVERRLGGLRRNGELNLSGSLDFGSDAAVGMAVDLGGRAFCQARGIAALRGAGAQGHNADRIGSVGESLFEYPDIR